MKMKKILTILFTILSAAPALFAGSETCSIPDKSCTIIVSNAAELQNLADSVSRCQTACSDISNVTMSITLDSDIILNTAAQDSGCTANWNSINPKFYGTFDGKGHSISGVCLRRHTISKPSASGDGVTTVEDTAAAMFISASGGLLVKNLTLENIFQSATFGDNEPPQAAAVFLSKSTYPVSFQDITLKNITVDADTLGRAPPLNFGLLVSSIYVKNGGDSSSLSRIQSSGVNIEIGRTHKDESSSIGGLIGSISGSTLKLKNSNISVNIALNAGPEGDANADSLMFYIGGIAGYATDIEFDKDTLNPVLSFSGYGNKGENILTGGLIGLIDGATSESSVANTIVSGSIDRQIHTLASSAAPAKTGVIFTALGGLFGMATTGPLYVQNATVSTDISDKFSRVSDLYIGGLCGMEQSDSGAYFSGITYSCTISTDSSSIQIAAIGGLSGAADIAVSAVAMNVSNSAVTGALLLNGLDRVDSNGTVYAGGVFGSMDNEGSSLVLNGVAFTGSLAATGDGRTIVAGGMAGIVRDTTSANASSPVASVTADSATVSAPLTVTAREIWTGALFGSITNALKVSIRNANATGTLSLRSKPESNATLPSSLNVSGENNAGGLIGIAAMVNELRISNSKGSAAVTFKFDTGDAHTGMTSPAIGIGGFIGSFSTGLGGSENAKLSIDSSAYTGTLRLSNAENMDTYAGGFIGKAEINKMPIDSLRIFSSYADGADGILIALSTKAETSGSMDIGGFIGKEGASLADIQVAYSRGDIIDTLSGADAGNPDSRISGYIGYGTGEKYIFNNTFFAGAISVTESGFSAKKSIVSGAFSPNPTLTPTVLSSRSNYIYDSKGAVTSFFPSSISSTNSYQSTTVTASGTDSSVIDTSSLKMTVASPAFTSALNDSSSGLWYYDPAAFNGFPQLISFAGESIMPTRRIYFEDAGKAYTAAYSEAEAYTGKTGKLAYKANGDGIDIKNLPPALYTDSTKNLMLSWKETSGGTYWSGASDSTVYKTSLTYTPVTKTIPAVTFALQQSSDNLVLSGKSASDKFYWNGQNFSLYGNDSLPSILYKDDSGKYRYCNVWHVSWGNSDTTCTTTQCYRHAISLAQSGGAEDTLQLDTNYSEAANSAVTLSNAVSLGFHTTVFSNSLDTAILSGNSYNIPLRAPFFITSNDPSAATGDSLLIISGTDTLNAAVGDTVSLAKYAPSISIAYKAPSLYTITFSVPDSVGKIFRSGNYPAAYSPSQSAVAVPQIASLGACFIGWATTAGDTLRADSTNSTVNWTPGTSSRNETFTAAFDTGCRPDTSRISVAADSGVVYGLSHYGETVTAANDSEYFLPRLTGLKLIVSAKPASSGYTLDSITYGGKAVSDADTILVSGNGTLRFYTTYKKPADTAAAVSFEIATATEEVSGSAVNLTVTPAGIRGSDKLRLSLRIYESGSDSLLLDSALTDGAEGKTYSLRYYPLAPGSYYAEMILANAADSVMRELSWNIARAKNYSAPGTRWQMFSLSGLDTSRFNLKDSAVSLYYWDEEHPIGDFWQYRALKTNKDIQPGAGYWLFAEDSIDLPVTSVAQRPAADDSITWNLKCRYSCWNLIANPYSWPVYLGNAANFTSASDEEAPFWRWDAETAQYVPADTLGAYEAVWARVNADTTYSISAAPVFAGLQASASSGSALGKAAPENGWSLRLRLVAEDGSADSWNIVGAGAKEISVAEPPAGVGRAVSLAIEGAHGALAKSIRDRNGSLTWKIQMKSSGARKASLDIDGLEELAARGYTAALTIDGQTKECKAGESIPVTLTASARTAELKISAGTEPEIAAGISGLRYALENGRIFITFTLPGNYAGAEERIQLIDAHGKMISETRGAAAAGENRLALNAPQGAGIFFLKITAGNSGKLLTLKF